VVNCTKYVLPASATPQLQWATCSCTADS
jgi:hypothetical protein